MAHPKGKHLGTPFSLITTGFGTNSLSGNFLKVVGEHRGGCVVV